jgi:hypothetical protein
VVRYLLLPHRHKVEGEFPAFLDGWFAHQDKALGVAQDWVSQHPAAN